MNCRRVELYSRVSCIVTTPLVIQPMISHFLFPPCPRTPSLPLQALKIYEHHLRFTSDQDFYHPYPFGNEGRDWNARYDEAKPVFQGIRSIAGNFVLYNNLLLSVSYAPEPGSRSSSPFFLRSLSFSCFIFHTFLFPFTNKAPFSSTDRSLRYPERFTLDDSVLYGEK